MENNKNKKSVKFQGDMLIFCDFIQVFVFTRNHHLNHSETDWNIRHAFRIWAYTDYFGSPRTPLMSVFGVRSECAETPKKKIGNSEKKFGSRRFWRVGRSTAN